MLFNIVFAVREIKKKRFMIQFSWSENVRIYESVSVIIWMKYKFMKVWKNRGERTTLKSDKISGLPSIPVRNDVKKHF